MHNSAVVIGHVISDLFRNIISGIIILLMGFLIGFRPNASIGDWGLVVLLALAFTLAISWLSAIMGLLVKTIEAAQWMGFILIFPLTFISSAFVKTSTMPHALRVFAENQPLTQVMNAMRAWLVGTPLGNSGTLAFIWCIGIIAVSVPITGWLFRRRSSK
jgi:ABC-2 type transport system permease protein